MRRGVPSAQAVWGNSVAILTGDLLFARASQLMAGLGERAIRLQADTFERLVPRPAARDHRPASGEDADRALHPGARRQDRLAHRRRRPGGVIFSDAAEEFERAVVEFGEKIGVAFQLIDDVIDLSPQPEETGKVPGTDLRAGVATLPLLYLRRDGRRPTPRPPPCSPASTPRSRADGRTTSADFAAAVAELREHPVTARTLAEAQPLGRTRPSPRSHRCPTAP